MAGVFLSVAIGKVLPKVIGKVWDYLIGGLDKDTVFPPVVLSFTLPSCLQYPTPLGIVNDEWFSVKSHDYDVHAQGGHYRLTIDWLLGPTNPA